MKRISLTKDKYALVDDKDFRQLASHKWYFDITGYASRRLSKLEGRKLVRMHREIMKPEAGMFVDHKNMDKLDNQRKNLRICTKAQNMMNRNKTRTNTSGFKGVSWDKFSGKWKAQIKVNKKSVNLGRYGSAKEGAVAYNNAVVKYYGEFARLNKI